MSYADHVPAEIPVDDNHRQILLGWWFRNHKLASMQALGASLSYWHGRVGNLLLNREATGEEYIAMLRALAKEGLLRN